MKYVLTIPRKGLAAVSSSFFAALCSAFGNYDVIHIHAEGPAYFSWIPKLFGKKIVWTCHGIDWKREKWKNKFGAQFIKKGEEKAVKYADEIIVLSKNIQDYFEKEYNCKTHFISNGVNRPEIRKAELITKKYGLTMNSYFLFLARLVPEKRADLLIEAYKRLDSDKKLVIAGGASDSGKYLEKMKRLANNNANIIFTGFVRGQELQELYSNAYIYILPSDLEGMPISLLEAMSYGNCCLVSDIPECKDVIKGHGVCFTHGDVVSLERVLKKLSENEQQVWRFKKNAADYICSEFSWDNTVNEIRKLYE